jgi:hypothetical protein
MEDLVVNKVVHKCEEATCLMAHFLKVVKRWQDNLMTTFD